MEIATYNNYVKEITKLLMIMPRMEMDCNITATYYERWCGELIEVSVNVKKIEVINSTREVNETPSWEVYLTDGHPFASKFNISIDRLTEDSLMEIYNLLTTNKKVA